MSPITQHPALLLITAFSILIVACLVAIHLRDRALREILDEALTKIPEAQRKDLIAVAISVGKGRVQ